jgi:hypothetical protein
MNWILDLLIRMFIHSRIETKSGKFACVGVHLVFSYMLCNFVYLDIIQ